jgi:diaminohydroxyphosphoribosylaminopyrimidine deaminase/5-amino-6-(5-phosphoribosylamino)uracil reductase
MASAEDYAYMAKALQLAALGLNTTTPNPRVGCVIVKEGRIIGEGFHARAGEPHAEVHALQQAGEQASGATAYVTLEPCSHFGRTPPCADALIKAGVKRVVAAMQDPNPKVAGSGLENLKSHGIEVESGVLEAEAAKLNQGFIARMTRGRPYVRLKVAASLDGRTALENGVSQWITGEAARLDVQQWRARSCAMLTGIGTLLADDARLTVRAFDIGRQPLRVVADSHLRTPTHASMLADAGVLIAHAHAPVSKVQALQAQGAEVVALPNAEGRVSLLNLMQLLGRRGINELLVEAGAEMNGALLRAGLVDELLLYFAPSLLGNTAHGMFAWSSFQTMQERLDLDVFDMRKVGADIRLQAYLK